MQFSIINSSSWIFFTKLWIKKRIMIHGGEVDSVRSHHSTSNTNHQTSPTLSQKTPGFAIQELLGLTSNNTSEHDSMNSSIKQLQHGDQQTNPFSYYNSKETLATICQPKSTYLHERNLKWNLNFTIKFLCRQICILLFINISSCFIALTAVLTLILAFHCHVHIVTKC